MYYILLAAIFFNCLCSFNKESSQYVVHSCDPLCLCGHCCKEYYQNMVSSYNLCFLVMWLPHDVFLTNHMLDVRGHFIFRKMQCVIYKRPHGTEKEWKSCKEMKSRPIVSIRTHRGFMLEGMHATPALNPLEVIHGSLKQTSILP